MCKAIFIRTDMNLIVFFTFIVFCVQIMFKKIIFIVVRCSICVLKRSYVYSMLDLCVDMMMNFVPTEVLLIIFDCIQKLCLINNNYM